MGWQITADPQAYAEHVMPLLARDPTAHTIALTVLDAVRKGIRWSDEPCWFGWHQAGGSVDGAIFQTPPHPLGLAVVPAGSEAELVAVVRDAGHTVAGVNGQMEAARRVGDAWRAGTGGSVTELLRTRLYRLDTLKPPTSSAVRGRPRRAGLHDLDLVMEWIVAFHLESHPDTATANRQQFRGKIEDGLVWFWEHDERPVSLAGCNPTTFGVARVGPVYTPPAERRHGYGSAVTAACTRDALERGAEQVVLFTDVANPTSNAIYQKIGYQPDHDRLTLAFSA